MNQTMMLTIGGLGMALLALSLVRSHRILKQSEGNLRWVGALTAARTRREDPVGFVVFLGLSVSLVLLLVHGLSLVIMVWKPGFHLFFHTPKLHGPYRLLTDLLSVFLLAVTGFEFFRRWVLKPPFLHKSLQAELVLAGIAFLALSNLLMEAGQIGKVSEIADDWALVSAYIAHALQVMDYGPNSCEALSGWMYWAHMFVAAGLIGWVPGTALVRRQMLETVQPGQIP